MRKVSHMHEDQETVDNYSYTLSLMHSVPFCKFNQLAIKYWGFSASHMQFRFPPIGYETLQKRSSRSEDPIDEIKFNR